MDTSTPVWEFTHTSIFWPLATRVVVHSRMHLLQNFSTYKWCYNRQQTKLLRNKIFEAKPCTHSSEFFHQSSKIVEYNWPLSKRIIWWLRTFRHSRVKSLTYPYTHSKISNLQIESSSDDVFFYCKPVWKSKPLRIVQEIEILSYYQMVYAYIRICPREWDVKFSGILRIKRSSNLGQKTRPSVNLLGKKFFVCFGFIAYQPLVGYLMPNPFFNKQIVLFQTTQFSISTHFDCQKHFYFKLFSFVKQFHFKQYSLA